MPTRNVSLTPELDRFIAAKIETGLYANASEVMRSALRLLEQQDRAYEQKMAVLRAAIAEGDAGGDAEGDVFEGLYAYIDELAAGNAGQQDEEIAQLQRL